MGSQWCSAHGCHNNSKKFPDLKFFRVVKEPIRARKWIINSRRHDLLKKSVEYWQANIYFCEVHFEPECFMDIHAKKKKLVWDAIPTLFEHTHNPPPKYGPTKSDERRRALIRKREKALQEAEQKVKELEKERIKEKAQETLKMIYAEKERLSIERAMKRQKRKSQENARKTLKERKEQRPRTMTKNLRTCHVKHFLYYMESHLDPRDLIIRCIDGSIRSSSLVLGSLSSVLHRCLLSDTDPLLILPGIRVEELDVFFECLFYTGNDLFHKISRKSIIHTIRKVCEALEVDIMPFLTDQEDGHYGIGGYDDVEEEEEEEEEDNLEEDLAEMEEDSVLNHSEMMEVVREEEKNEEDLGEEEDDDDDDVFVPEESSLLSTSPLRAETSSVSSKFRSKVGSGSLNCRYCHRMYWHLKARNKHMISEHFALCSRDGLVYPCNDCGTNFITELGRDKHMLRIHNSGRLVTSSHVSNKNSDVKERRDSSKVITCPFPHIEEHPSVFKSFKALKLHVKRSHPDKDKSCMACGLEVGSTREELHKHIQTHIGDEGKLFYQCNYCSEKFLTEYNVITHKRMVHSTATDLKCKFCQKEFKNPKFHKSHEEKHELNLIGPSEFQCQVITQKGETCNKVFKLKSNLERHIRSHNKIKTHKCEDCGKCFVDSTRLKEHRWIHTGHKPYQCRFCDKSFRHTNHVKHHEASVHGSERKFQCHVCFKKFVYAYMLKSHLNNHESVKSKSKEQDSMATTDEIKTVYQCSLCHKFYGSLEALEDHCSEHAGGVVIDLRVEDSTQVDLSSLVETGGGEKNRDSSSNPIFLRVPDGDNDVIDQTGGIIMESMDTLEEEEEGGGQQRQQQKQHYVVVYDMDRNELSENI